MTLPRDQRGAILLLSVIVMAAVGLTIFLAANQMSLNAIATGREQTHAWTVRLAVFGCLEEALIQLAGDPSFNAPTVATNQATCNVAYQTVVGTTDVLVTWTSGDISRGVRARVTLAPLVISEIEETLTF